MLCTTTAIAAEVGGRVMTDAQWRQDLDQLASAIRDIHFKPFHNTSAAAFDDAVASLQATIPERSDAEIIVGMAQIVATLRDGHTRLHLPRLYPELALEAELGHSGTPPPAFDGLRFTQLPVRFGLFEDGLFVTAATADHETLIGREVERIGKLPVGEALQSVKSTSFFENESRARLLAPDRLALPDVLAALGIVAGSDAVPLAVAGNAGSDDSQLIDVRPLTTPGAIFLDGGPVPAPLWQRHRELTHWYEILPERDAIFVQVNQFAESPARPYSDFVGETLAEARRAGVTRYIVDLRHNSGGIGEWVIPFATGLSRSEFNRYGRLYVLMGRTTFSAAQHFLHEFEKNTFAIFVGEPGGAKPSHFGDGRRIVLDNSGLTLRVSTIYWHSWLANDFRDAINPHLDAPLASDDHFAGRDPALEAASRYTPPDSLALQIDEQLRKGKVQNGLLLLQRFMTDGTVAKHDRILPSLGNIAAGLVEDGYVKPGYFVFFVANNYFPGHADIETGLANAERLMESTQ